MVAGEGDFSELLQKMTNAILGSIIFKTPETVSHSGRPYSDFSQIQRLSLGGVAGAQWGDETTSPTRFKGVLSFKKSMGKIFTGGKGLRAAADRGKKSPRSPAKIGLQVLKLIQRGLFMAP